MSNKYILIILLLFLGIAFSSCKQEASPKVPQIQWSGLNPGRVPDNIRFKEIGKGNLITNPSFEVGKYYYSDTLKLSFNLPGWKKVGENVFWTNTEEENKYNSEDASKGIHAIKISRSHADETDHQGEGILSNYIKVIPGNYILKLDIRLKHIQSNLTRYRTGIYDGVNIRLFFYDKNKVLIRNSVVHPEYDIKIDPAFKVYNFSNNNDIDEFAWASIVARSGNFPFEEGNIPDDTRYIKIFAGLKGTGEMWIDYFRFEYSNRNFTYLEQLQKLRNTKIKPSDYLFPEPQRLDDYQKLNLGLKQDSLPAMFPFFISPVLKSTAEKRHYAKLIKSLKSKSLLSKRAANFSSRFNQNKLDASSLVFSFGTNKFSAQFKDRLPYEEIEGKEQAYFIKKLVGENYIFIDYTDTEGMERAIWTLMQLIDTTKDVYHHYDIVDYPDFTRRSVTLPLMKEKEGADVKQSMDLLSSFGYNSFLVKLNPENSDVKDLLSFTKRWYRYYSEIKKNKSYLNYGFYVEKLPLNESSDLFSNSSVKANGENHKLTIKKAILIGAGASAKFHTRLNEYNPDFWVFSDRFEWNAQHDLLQTNSITGRITDLVESRKIFWKEFSDKFSISTESNNYLIPFFGNNREIGEFGLLSFLYWKNLSLTEMDFDKILWCGPVEYPEYIDKSDVFGYLNENKMPISLLNRNLSVRKEDYLTGSYYSLFPGRAITASLFKGFDTDIEGLGPEVFGGECFVDVDVLSELGLIPLLSSLEFYWNSSAYDPVFSSWKILTSLYGEDIAMSLVLFNDIYYKLFALSIESEKYGYNSKIDKTGQQYILEMNKYWEEITASLTSHLNLLNELSDLKNALISRFYQSRRGNGHVNH